MGAATDIDGKFRLENVKKGATLVVTYIGMQTKTVKAGENMKIYMTSDSKSLDEVVVQVAYGAAKKSTLTGAVTQVDSKQIEVRPVSSVTSALEGTTSGVQINSTYGQPGEEPSIRIRGFGTVNGSATPLYVLDGVPFGGNISDLNSNDIESITVLKDAASCALYGNRASNGVILITTKRGKGEKMAFNLKVNQGTYSRGIKEYKVLNAKEFMETSWLNLRNSRISAGDDQATANAYASKNLINDELYLNIYNKAEIYIIRLMTSSLMLMVSSFLMLRFWMAMLMTSIGMTMPFVTVIVRNTTSAEARLLPRAIITSLLVI